MPDEGVPDWVWSSRFYSVSRTDEELSLVCESQLIPPEKYKAERGWRCLKVQGPLDFALTGVLSSLAAPLAAAKISLFAISTFDTDYLLVKEESVNRAMQVLTESGFVFI